MSSIPTFTPREIVSELDHYIIGQREAKRAVAIALRNRWRRQQVPGDLRDEIAPKNIIMIGPTGVGKTEIARRIARLVKAPFIKVEASKFTEVGYVGRDVESYPLALERRVHLARPRIGSIRRKGCLGLHTAQLPAGAGRVRAVAPGAPQAAGARGRT